TSSARLSGCPIRLVSRSACNGTRNTIRRRTRSTASCSRRSARRWRRGSSFGREGVAMEIRPIRSQADYDAAVAEIERLWNADPGTDDGDKLDILATLVERYENEHWPI